MKTTFVGVWTCPLLPTTMSGMSPSGELQRSLKEWLEERRVELGMTQDEVAKAARMSREGLRLAREGIKNPQPLTRHKIDVAMRWAPGSVTAILTGGEPVRLEDLDPEETEMRERLRELRQRVGRERAKEILRAELDDIEEENTLGDQPDAAGESHPPNG